MRTQALLGIFNNGWQVLAQVDGPRREGEAAFQQESADLVDQRRATLHQSVAHTVHGLPIELLLRFDLHKAHVLLGHGFGDCLGVDEVVLVRLAVGFDELRRDEPHLVPLCSQGTTQEVRSGTGFKPDQRCGQLRGIS